MVDKFEWYQTNYKELQRICRTISKSLEQELLSYILDLMLDNVDVHLMEISILSNRLKQFRNQYYKQIPRNDLTTSDSQDQGYIIGEGTLLPTVESLPNVYKMYVIDKLTFKQIANLMNTSESSIRRQYWKSFYDLRKQFTTKPAQKD